MFLQIIRQYHQRHEAFLKAVVYVSFEIEIGINSDTNKNKFQTLLENVSLVEVCLNFLNTCAKVQREELRVYIITDFFLSNIFSASQFKCSFCELTVCTFVAQTYRMRQQSDRHSLIPQKHSISYLKKKKLGMVRCYCFAVGPRFL